MLPKNKVGRPQKNSPAGQPTYYPSMKAAAFALKIDISILKNAREKACEAFGPSGAVHRIRLLDWLKDNSNLQNSLPALPTDGEWAEVYEEVYDTPDEAGGVGQTLQSLQAYERRLKKQLDQLERATNISAIEKEARVEKAQKRWISVVGPLLKYDLSVSLAKRESGELIPLADAIKAVQALLAWHTVATSDALRNVIPNLERLDKYQIAAVLDPALRSSIYRNFKLGMKIGKIPEWMGKAASDFVRSEPPLGDRSEPPLGVAENPVTEKASNNLDDY